MSFIASPIPENEESRLQAVEKAGVLDNLNEEIYNVYCHLSRQITKCPESWANVIDKNRQYNFVLDGKNINDIVNKTEINFKKVFIDKKFDNFKNYSFTKYTTDDILFNGNRGAVATAYIDFYNNDKNLFIATYDGIFAFANLNDIKKFQKINSNINSLIKYEKFYFNEQYGIKDIHIDDNRLYVSYIGEQKNSCHDLKIIAADLNEQFLNFKLFFKTQNCVDINNNHGYWAPQGAGGRIVNLDNSNLLFTTGDFRNRPLSQDVKSDYGKILKINIQSKNSEVVSLGHRNPQGLYYSNKFDFILSTEHGPKGGDEININNNPFSKVKNFGWPISSYGEHYAKKNAIFLHSLPRGSEVSNEVFLSKKSKVWQQAENRIHVQKSILLYCFDKLR